MTLRDILKIARRWWLPVIVVAALAGTAAYVATKQMTPVYRSTTTLLVNQAQTPGVPTYQDILGSQQLTKTYSELATSNLNLERAAAALESEGVTFPPGDLSSRLSARPVPGTQLISVTAEHADPARAALYANTVSEEFIGYIREAQLGGASQSPSELPVNSVFIAARAMPADSPSEPNVPFNVAAGVLAGLGLAICAVVAFEYLNDRVTTREEIDRIGAPFLGRVSRAAAPRFGRSPTFLPPGADAGMLESIREVQASLAFATTTSDAKVILVTSPGAKDGKSTTAASLAAAIAESSKRVLLLDGDLRKPDAHRYFSLPNTSGLSTAIIATPEQLPSFVKGVSELLYVLTAGPAPPNPTQIISSPRMQALMQVVRSRFDVVIVDGPPLAGIADATLWASLADGVVVVARHGQTRRAQLADSIRRLAAASSTPLLGVILNGTRREPGSGYYYAPYPSRPSRGGDGNSRPPRSGWKRASKEHASIAADDV